MPKPMELTDRTCVVIGVATGLLLARVIGLRGQQMPKGDIIQCIDDAETLMGEIDKRYGTADEKA